ADTISRAVTERLSQRLGQPVVVENRPGGKQIIGTMAVVGAPADGHTLLLSSVSSLSLNPVTVRELPYDVDRDLTPVTRLFHAPLLLVTTPSVPGDTAQDLASYARANPNKLSYASIGPGSSTHIAAELFNLQADVDTAHIPYKGSAPAILDLLSDNVQFMFDGGTSSLPHVESGKLKVRAVTTAERFPYLPDIPTMAEQGFPDYEVSAWWGVSAPAGTPLEVRERIAAELRTILDDKELLDRFGANGVALGAGTPQEFAEFIERENTRWTDFFAKSSMTLE
ncbi:MAG: Bug family tripartite tricarboxylate transporter substrate binding protein, partial [Pigmentiphaga sp.]